MFLFELYNEIPPGYHSDKDDNSVMKLKDLRKSRLTLAHLNRLRLANDMRKFEKEEEVEQISDQYKPPAAEAGAMPGM